MAKYLNELVRSSFIYGLSGAIVSFISFFLVPIYTRVFTPADYGVISIVNTTYFLLGILVIFGMDNAATYWYWNNTDEQDRKTTFATWTYFSLGLSLLAFAFLLIFSDGISRLFFGDTKNSFFFVLMGIALIFRCIQRIANIWLRVEKRPVATMIYALVVALTNISFSILFVVWLDWRLLGVFVSMVLSSMLSVLIAVLFIPDAFRPRSFDLARLSEMLKFSYPIVPAAISLWLMNSAAVILINAFVSRAQVGLFQIGISLATVLSVAVFGFLQAWSPFAYSISGETDHKLVYADVLTLYSYVFGLLSLLLALFAPEVLWILTPKAYYDAALVAGLLGLNLAISNMSQIVVIGCSIKRDNKPFGASVLFGTTITWICFFILIPTFGKEGAASAMILGNLVSFLYVYSRAQKLYPVPYNLKTVILVFGFVATLFLGMSILALELSFVALIGAKLVVIAIFSTFVLVNIVKLQIVKEFVRGMS